MDLALRVKRNVHILLGENVGGSVMSKDRDIDKESEIRRETKTYEEESGLLEEDKI